MKTILALTTAILLSACGQSKIALPPVRAQSNASVECPDLRLPMVGERRDIWEDYAIDTYLECKLRHKALIKSEKIIAGEKK